MQQGHCNHGTLDRGLVAPSPLQNRAREEAPIRRNGSPILRPAKGGRWTWTAELRSRLHGRRTDRSCEIPISHARSAGFPSCEVAGRDSRQSGCENGFSHQHLDSL